MEMGQSTVRFHIHSLPFPFYYVIFITDLQIFVPKMNSLVKSFVHWYLLCTYVYAPGLQFLSRERFCFSNLQVLSSSGSTNPRSGSFWVCLPPENAQTKSKFQSIHKYLYILKGKWKKKKSQLLISNNSSFEDWNSTSWCMQAAIFNIPEPQTKSSHPKDLHRPSEPGTKLGTTTPQPLLMLSLEHVVDLQFSHLS